MPQPPFETLAEDGPSGYAGKRPVDINLMKRNMSIAKGFLDISLLTANANQLRNVMNFGNEGSSLHVLTLTGITISIILQITSGVALLVSERFDINKEEEQERGDRMNTVVTSLIFLVLVINVFVACLGVDVAEPKDPYSHLPPSKVPYPTDHKGVFDGYPH